MKSICSLAVLSFLFASSNTFAECAATRAISPKTAEEALSAIESRYGDEIVTCVQDLGATFDAPQFVITLDQRNNTVRLEKSGGAWGKGKDYGVSRVVISTNNRGYVPSKKAVSVDSSGNITDELRLTISGAIGEATVRIDSDKGSRFLKMNLRCE